MIITLSQAAQISGAVQTGRADYVQTLVLKAVDDGIPADEILQDGLLEGMRQLGIKFRRNEAYVPEVLVAARALNRGVETLRPWLVSACSNPAGKAVVATVKGDMHDVGKNLVSIMLSGAGFEVVDLGVDVPASVVVDAVRHHRPCIVALSALLSSTMAQQGMVISALEEAGLRQDVKVMVGGAPVTQAFCDHIGADAYAPDAASCAMTAAMLARQIKQV